MLALNEKMYSPEKYQVLNQCKGWAETKVFQRQNVKVFHTCMGEFVRNSENVRVRVCVCVCVCVRERENEGGEFSQPLMH